MKVLLVAMTLCAIVRPEYLIPVLLTAAVAGGLWVLADLSIKRFLGSDHSGMELIHPDRNRRAIHD